MGGSNLGDNGTWVTVSYDWPMKLQMLKIRKIAHKEDVKDTFKAQTLTTFPP